ncbi:transposase [Micromonospora sp. MA102]|uniref:transposase n=1 Tax=Micromonospora sp. MA102 TaxID=2952755 RepID=UPI0021C9F3AC|nr:transposase [Micromonospora sp. MA102]
MHSLVDLSLAAEHRRGHGALYDGLNSCRIAIGQLRTTLAGLPLPRTADGQIVLAVDVSNGCAGRFHLGGPAVLPRLRPGEVSGPDDPAGRTRSSPRWSPAAPRGPRSWTWCTSARPTTPLP